MLIEAGADIDIKDKNDNTALKLAMFRNNNKIVELIKDRKYLENLKKLVPVFIKAAQEGNIKNFTIFD